MPHLHGLAQAVLQHALDAGREGQMPRHVGVLVDGHHLDMLGAHVGLMKRASLVLSQDEHLARFVGEFLE